jgi:hypothetical protein
LSRCASSGPSNTTVGNSLSPLPNHDSSFYLSTDHEQVWLRLEEQSPERPRHIIQDPQMMVTIAWNPLRFHLLEAISKGNTFNAEYYPAHVLTELLCSARRLMGGDSLFMLTT